LISIIRKIITIDRNSSDFLQDRCSLSGRVIVFKRRTNKETGRLEGVEFCKNIKNILMGSKECKRCEYFRWMSNNKVVCSCKGKIVKVFNL
jgi:hypothetical protein